MRVEISCDRWRPSTSACHISCEGDVEPLGALADVLPDGWRVIDDVAVCPECIEEEDEPDA